MDLALNNLQWLICHKTKPNQNKININIHLQAIAVSATLLKSVSICSLYIPSHDLINKKELNNLIKQLLNNLSWWGNFNTHNIWRSKTTKEARPLKKLSIATICLHYQKSQIYLDSSSGTLSAIDLTLSDSSIFIDYNWRVYKDLCSSDHSQ